MTTNNPEIERLLPAWQEAGRALLSGPTDKENDELADRYSDIEDAILAQPARTWSDIRVKSEILWRQGGPATSENALAILREMALMDSQPSRVFDPVAWLEWFERLNGCWIERDGEIILMAPVGGRANGALAELEACNANEQVRAFIRQRSGERQHA